MINQDVDTLSLPSSSTSIITNRTLTEKHLKKFSSFLDSHSIKLLDILQDNHHHHKNKDIIDPVQSYPIVSHIWDATTDPIDISITNQTQIIPRHFEEIISIPTPPEGNPDVPKVLLVLVTLSDALSSLKSQLHSKFIPTLTLYGDGFDFD